MHVRVNACVYVNTDAELGVNTGLWNVRNCDDPSTRRREWSLIFFSYRDNAGAMDWSPARQIDMHT